MPWPRCSRSSPCGKSASANSRAKLSRGSPWACSWRGPSGWNMRSGSGRICCPPTSPCRPIGSRFATWTLTERTYRDAILSGLFAGAGMLFRLDAVLAVPAIGLIMVMFAPRFVRSSFFFGAGVLPSLALASWLNYLKFGTPNPFSYGSSGGNTDLSAYGPTSCRALRRLRRLLLLGEKSDGGSIARQRSRRLSSWAVRLLVIPATNAWLLRFWNGFLALVVDIRGVDDHRVGVTARAGRHADAILGPGEEGAGPKHAMDRADGDPADERSSKGASAVSSRRCSSSSRR